MKVKVIIIVIGILGILGLFGLLSSGQTGGRPFSNVNEPSMAGIQTWEGRQNPSNPNRPIMETDKDQITYYGHGLPLIPIVPGPIIGPLKIAHNSGIATSPECCPSPYSSDRGCFCGAIEELRRQSK